MVVVFLPDSGDRYLSKIYNDDWMRSHQYWETELPISAHQVVQLKLKHHPGSHLIFATASDSAQHALRLMQDNEISQLPVFKNGKCIGTVREVEILNLALRGTDLNNLVLIECMKDPLPILDPSSPIDRLMYMLTKESPAVLVKLTNNHFEILTKYDLLHMIATLSESTAHKS